VPFVRDVSEICYLCGSPLDAAVEEIDVDHVPPRQFYSKELRSKEKLNLFTLPTHRKCNRKYQADEEYFIHTFAPLVMDTYSGRSILKELLKQYRTGRNVRLNRKVLAEFQKRPSGLYLPPGKVVKRFDSKRVRRVVWKITRGLFFYENGRFLPEDTPRAYKIVSPGEKPPDEFFLIPESTRGKYPGIFAYRFMKMDDIDFHIWAILFWDKIITLVYFHDPDCTCDGCRKP
jgi:hypothetical protein